MALKAEGHDRRKAAKLAEIADNIAVKGAG